LVGRDELPDLETLTARFRPRAAQLPNVSVHLPELALYDALVDAA
jgi:hypothetical protein